MGEVSYVVPAACGIWFLFHADVEVPASARVGQRWIEIPVGGSSGEMGGGGGGKKAMLVGKHVYGKGRHASQARIKNKKPAAPHKQAHEADDKGHHVEPEKNARSGGILIIDG